MSTILMIDLSSLWWPLYKSTAGEDVATANRVALSRVHELASRYEHCAIAADSRNSFRKELSGTYKSNRESDPVAQDLLYKLQSQLAADGFVIWQREGFEADDVIATATVTAVAAGHDVVIAGVDKDLLALLGPSVKLYHTMRQSTFDADAVKDKLGVTPAQIPDYLALVGDASDAIPGVDGCGPKHAARLLAEFGSLDAVVLAADSGSSQVRETVTPKSVRFNLVESNKSGTLALSRKLIALRYDVPRIDPQDALAPRVPKPQEQERDYMADEAPEQEAPPPTETPAPPAEPKQPEAPKPEPKPNTALAVIQAEIIAPTDARFQVALEPREFTEGKIFAKAAFDSRMYPALTTPQMAWIVITAGRSMGLSAVAALQGAHIIQGKLCWHAAIVVGRVMASGRAEYIEVESSDEKHCTWVAKRPGRPEKKLTWTLATAKAAGLLGKADSNWDKYPRTMLQWRCGVEIARMVFPDVTANIYTPEEMGETAQDAPGPTILPGTAGSQAVAENASAAPASATEPPNSEEDILDMLPVESNGHLDGAAQRRIWDYAHAVSLDARDLAGIVSKLNGGGEFSGELAKTPASLEPMILAAIKDKVRADVAR